mgnify:CR=1 FL=1
MDRKAIPAGIVVGTPGFWYVVSVLALNSNDNYSKTMDATSLLEAIRSIVREEIEQASKNKLNG